MNAYSEPLLVEYGSPNTYKQYHKRIPAALRTRPYSYRGYSKVETK